MEAIILAGGLGTRLRSEVQDVPKSMALIQDRPFVEYLLDYLIDAGVQHIIFSIGYKSQIIQDHFSNVYRNCKISYAVETQLLGTGGAIKNAMTEVQDEHVIVLNGDSLFITQLKDQYQTHLDLGADVTLALKPMKNFNRYGTVELTENNRITAFNEKREVDEGLINTGSYIFNVKRFKETAFPEKFSIEREFFETHVVEKHFYAYRSEGYFLDIGIPKDFKKAQYEIGIFPKIDKSWTLFLDRDGVINKKRDNDYVKTTEELELLPGAIEAIASLSKIFGRLIIVTNQQGVGKKLMTAESLSEIHQVIIQNVENLGGHIDAIYYAPQLVAERSPMRKPQIGMALKAKEDFPEIDFEKAIMIGDSPSDIQFAKNAKMIPISIGMEDKEGTAAYNLNALSEFDDILQSILQPRD